VIGQFKSAPPGFARVPDAMKLGFHCVRTPGIRGFIAFRLARLSLIVMLMVPV
jgi:hypothetical protein